MKLLDDNGTVQAILLETGDTVPHTGYTYGLTEPRYHSDTLFKIMKFFGYHDDEQGWRDFTTLAGSEMVERTVTPRGYKYELLVTTLELFPRKNQYGEVSP